MNAKKEIIEDNSFTKRVLLKAWFLEAKHTANAKTLIVKN